MAAVRTRRAPVQRAAWLAGVATAGGVTAGVVLLGGSAPAFAVTQHPNGTVTVSIAKPSGVRPANDKLRILGDPVVVVPVGPGCPSIASLPMPKPKTPGQPIKVTASGSESNGTLTVDAHGVPAGDTMIIAASPQPNGGMLLGSAVISGPVPSCVSLPAPPPGASRAPGAPGVPTGPITSGGSSVKATSNG